MTILASALLSVTVAAAGDGARDFDFLLGHWKVHNRRLRERLKGSTGWDEFEATHTARPLPGGLGNQDEYRTSYWPDFLGMTLRFFNPQTRQWAIHWIDNRRRVLDPPVVGSFTGDRGIFEGHDTLDGRPILVRFIWSRVTTATPRWEQAFSADSGKTWETNWIMDFARAEAPAVPDADCCAVLELRQYTLKPARRDDLIALFERHFVESQEAAGITVVGHFRDRHRADRFVWLRGFRDMANRHAALERFYGGPVWAEHRAAANDTMIDSDDVLLLRPARPDTRFHLNWRNRSTPGEERPASIVVAGIQSLRKPADAGTLRLFDETVAPRLRDRGVRVDALFVTEEATNTFTRLPVREGEHVMVWFGTVNPEGALSSPELARSIDALNVPGEPAPVVLELQPASRSLYGRSPAQD
jgi:hypothetical protein